MIKNIILDIGNVLLDFRPNEYFYSLFDSKELVDRCMNALFATLDWEQFDLGYITMDEVKENAILKEPGLEKELTDMLQRWMDIMSKMPLYDDIEGFRQKGYKVYLLSNLNKNSDEYIEEHYDLYNIVDGLIISNRVHKVKPYTDIYACLVDTYHLDKEECIFIDDSKVNVESMEEFGIHSILYTKYDEVVKELNTYVK